MKNNCFDINDYALGISGCYIALLDPISSFVPSATRGLSHQQPKELVHLAVYIYINYKLPLNVMLNILFHANIIIMYNITISLLTDLNRVINHI